MPRRRYGQFDGVTHEWSDGILAITYRYAAQQEKIHNIPDRQCCHFHFRRNWQYAHELLRQRRNTRQRQTGAARDR